MTKTRDEIVEEFTAYLGRLVDERINIISSNIKADIADNADGEVTDAILNLLQEELDELHCLKIIKEQFVNYKAIYHAKHNNGEYIINNHKRPKRLKRRF